MGQGKQRAAKRHVQQVTGSSAKSRKEGMAIAWRINGPPSGGAEIEARRLIAAHLLALDGIDETDESLWKVLTTIDELGNALLAYARACDAIAIMGNLGYTMQPTGGAAG
jgi:hypothetical protein